MNRRKFLSMLGLGSAAAIAAPAITHADMPAKVVDRLTWRVDAHAGHAVKAFERHGRAMSHMCVTGDSGPELIIPTQRCAPSRWIAVAGSSETIIPLDPA